MLEVCTDSLSGSEKEPEDILFVIFPLKSFIFKTVALTWAGSRGSCSVSLYTKLLFSPVAYLQP